MTNEQRIRERIVALWLERNEEDRHLIHTEKFGSEVWAKDLRLSRSRLHHATEVTELLQPHITYSANAF